MLKQINSLSYDVPVVSLCSASASVGVTLGSFQGRSWCFLFLVFLFFFASTLELIGINVLIVSNENYDCFHLKISPRLNESCWITHLAKKSQIKLKLVRNDFSMILTGGKMPKFSRAKNLKKKSDFSFSPQSQKVKSTEPRKGHGEERNKDHLSRDPVINGLPFSLPGLRRKVRNQPEI